MRQFIKLAGTGTLVLGALAISIPALAYTVGPGSSASAPATVRPGQPFTFKATFVQPTGAAYPAGVAITFSQRSGPSGCTASFNPGSANTDTSGSVSTQATIPAGCTGQFVLAATDTTGGGSVAATVTAVAGGFPNTSAAGGPDGPRADARPGAGLLLLGLVLVAIGAAGRRLRAGRLG